MNRHSLTLHDALPICSDDLFRESTDSLDAFGRKYFGCRSVGNVHRLRITRCHLPVEQFVEAIRRVNLAERASYVRSEENTSELQSLMRISYAVFCLKKKNTNNKIRY